MRFFQLSQGRRSGGDWRRVPFVAASRQHLPRAAARALAQLRPTGAAPVFLAAPRLARAPGGGRAIVWLALPHGVLPALPALAEERLFLRAADYWSTAGDWLRRSADEEGNDAHGDLGGGVGPPGGLR